MQKASGVPVRNWLPSALTAFWCTGWWGIHLVGKLNCMSPRYTSYHCHQMTTQAWPSPEKDDFFHQPMLA